jgi:hypothetical protein
MATNPTGVSTDPTNPVPTAGQAVPGVSATPTSPLPGTAMPLPSGTGIETLTAISPPFRSNAPKWLTPPNPDGTQSVWSRLGCAVPEPGRYIQTGNTLIWAVNEMIGRGLFHVAWKYQDRLFDRWPSRDYLWDLHQLITVGRNRLTAKTTADNGTPLRPTHSTPNYQMFVAYPIPHFGPLGCPNTWMHETHEILMEMRTEAMQHADNQLNYYYTTDFFNALYPYLQYVLADMAVKFFGEDPTVAQGATYVIPTAKWQAFSTAANSISFEATSTRPPLGEQPTDLDLEPIRNLTYSTIIPFLQPWPDSRLLYSSGGIWGNPSAPSSTGTQTGTPGTTATAATTPNVIDPTSLIRTGPPAA